jgi:uncharacterized iron-regulated membrane protein
MTLKNRRKFWLKVHCYLGLFAGLVFVIIGLTGSLLAFEHPLDEALNAKLIRVSAKQHQMLQPLNTIINAGLNAMPNNGKALNIDFPLHEGLAYTLWFESPSHNPDYPERHQIFINPYTAEVTGQRLLIDFDHIWRDPFTDFVLRLHYTLGLGDNGMTLVGFIGMALLLLLLTGLIVWYPLTGQFKKALTIKRHASFTRFVFDLHKVIGFYSSVFLLFLAASGIYLIFPDYGRGLVSVFSPVTAWTSYQSSAATGTPLTFEQVVAITDAHFPDGSYQYIVFPQHCQDVYQVGKRAPDEVNQRHSYRQLWIDQYNGNIVHEQHADTRTAGDVFDEWIYPLHTGEAFGLMGQLIILVSGLIPLMLYVTGFIRWLQKRQAAR